MEFVSVLQTLGETTSPFVILILAVLFSMEKGWLPKLFALRGDSQDFLLKSILESQKELQAHYNDTTTSVLQEIRDDTRSSNKILNVVATRQEFILDLLSKRDKK